jgi:hypothetical protein
MRGAPLWVVPGQGVHYDARLSALLPGGPAPRLAVPAGWTAQRTIGGVWRSPHGRLALYGRPGVPAGWAEVGAAAAHVLGVSGGQAVRIGGRVLTVHVVGGSRIVTVRRELVDGEPSAPAGGPAQRWPAAQRGQRDSVEHGSGRQARRGGPHL